MRPILDEVTDRVIAQRIHADTSGVHVAPGQLAAGSAVQRLILEVERGVRGPELLSLQRDKLPAMPAAHPEMSDQRHGLFQRSGV